LDLDIERRRDLEGLGKFEGDDGIRKGSGRIG
jgi:hypothetical protein